MNFHIKLFVLLLLFSASTLNVMADNERILWTVDWSPDDQWIAVGGNHDYLKIYSGKDFTLLNRYPVDGTITAVRWHPTRNLLAVATQGSSKGVFLLDYDKNQILTLNGMEKIGARGLDWNYDGQYLGIGGGEGVVHIFTQDRDFVRSIPKENTKSYTTLSWHPSQNIFVVASEKVRLFDINGHAIHTFDHREQKVLILSTDWHPSGEFFALGDYGVPGEEIPALLLHLNEKGQNLKSIKGSKAEYRSMAWHKKGKQIATASDVLRIWSKEGKLLAEGLSQNDYLWGLDWNKKGNRIITSSSEGKIQIWNRKAKLLRTLAD